MFNLNLSRNKTPLSLTIGVLILLIVAGVGLVGPLIAPRDPAEFNYIMKEGTQLYQPPFPPFISAAFPLGSDSFGRDTLSQLLWAIRPTLLLVVGVTLIRGVLGTAIGLAAGWSERRWLDTLIALALMLPVLLIALLVIAALGAGLGAFAFVLGLVLTGWGDIARVIREETRIIKQQGFIEAARAQGQPPLLIVLKHVLRQMGPTLGILFPLEAGSALLTIAALGFLGYFVGGTSWVMTADFVATRMSGMPELGQLLASAAETRNRNFGLVNMLMIGGVVLLLIMSCNLISEGLRARSLREQQRRSRLSNLGGFLERNLEEGLIQLGRPATLRRPVILVGVPILLLAIAAAALMLRRPAPSVPAVIIPGGHLWASERRDPSGSLRADSNLPTSAISATVWFSDSARFVGGPAIDAAGNLYIASTQELIALNGADARVRWRAKLPEPVIGTPALNAAGEIYLIGERGNVLAYTPQGAPKWQFTLDPAAPALTGGVVGNDGTLYYPIEGYVVAVAPDGTLKWRSSTTYSYFSPYVRLAGDFLFFKDMVLHAKTGNIALNESREMLDQFVTGADGRVYLASDKTLLEWVADGNQVGLAQAAQWDYSKQFPGNPTSDAGVTTDGQAWILFGSEYQAARLAWLTLDGQILNTVNFPQRPSRVMAIGNDNTLITCGTVTRSTNQRGGECLAFKPGTNQPLWKAELSVGNPLGGALANGRLFVAMSNGELFVLR